MNIEEIRKVKEQAKNARIVLVSGNFNILHPGHLRLLRFARECGDFLFVAVNGDGTDPGIILPEEERLNGIKANIWVDYALILDTSVDKLIAELKPAIVVKGKEHQSRFNVEQKALESYGGRLIFASGDVTFSTIELLKQDNTSQAQNVIREFHDYALRHKISTAALEEKLNAVSRKHIAVIGESIIDEYIKCEMLGVSREEPCLVVSPLDSRRYIGGAAIVAAHLANLGAQVDFFTITGEDECADFLTRELKSWKIGVHLFTDNSRPTILKQRFRVENRSMFRLSHLRQHEISGEMQEAILACLRSVISQFDILIFSDFNYGMLPTSLVQKITELAADAGVFIIADSQSSSQQGDISRYYHTKLLTPTEYEARMALRDTQSGLVVLSEKLRKDTDGENIFLKLGADGILIHAFDRAAKTWETDRLPAVSINPVDVAGAGDSLLACAAIALGTGATIWEAAFMGALGAGCQVERLGNVPLSMGELKQKINGFVQ